MHFLQHCNNTRKRATLHILQAFCAMFYEQGERGQCKGCIKNISKYIGFDLGEANLPDCSMQV